MTLLPWQGSPWVFISIDEQHTVCQALSVFAYGSRFRDDMPQNYIHEIINLDVPTNDMQEIVSLTVKALKRSWKTGTYYYKKAGVVAYNITEDKGVQGSLFDTVDRDKQANLSKIVDEINTPESKYTSLRRFTSRSKIGKSARIFSISNILTIAQVLFQASS